MSDNLKFIHSMVYIIEVFASLMRNIVMTGSQPPRKNERQQSVNNLESCALGNHTADGSSQLLIYFWPARYAKQIAISSQPHIESVCQQSIDDFWLCILGSHTTNRL
jgi:hypothetical protein